MAVVYKAQLSNDGVTFTEDPRQGTQIRAGFNWQRWIRAGHGPGTYYLQAAASLDSGATWSNWSPTIGPLIVKPLRLSRTILLT